MKALTIALLLALLFPLHAKASLYQINRKPILVNSAGTIVLTRTLTSDRKLYFELCGLSKEALPSEETLENHLNSSFAHCNAQIRKPMDLEDPKALQSLISGYNQILPVIFKRATWTKIEPVVTLASISGLATFATLMLVLEQIRPEAAFEYATKGAAGAFALASAATLRWSMQKSKKLRKRPPNEVESDLGKLIEAHDVTDPANFTSDLIFQCVIAALLTAPLTPN